MHDRCLPSTARLCGYRLLAAPVRGERYVALLFAPLVVAACLLTTIGPSVSPAYAVQGPHGSYGSDTDTCKLCHRLHTSESSNERPLFGQSETELCLACHDDAALGAATSVGGGDDGFGLASHHVLEDEATASDLTNACGSCHNPHVDPTRKPAMLRARINGAPTAGQSATELCLDCHDDARSWESTGTPSHGKAKDARGKAVHGTFPGKSVYLDEKLNPHARIATDTVIATGAAGPAEVAAPGSVGAGGGDDASVPLASDATSGSEGLPSASHKLAATSGDCRVCHGVHGGPNGQDLLTLSYRTPTTATAEADLRDGDYAALCFACHGGQSEWLDRGAADIRSRTTTTGVSLDIFPGHRIVTSGGERPAPSPLLCSDCHDAHGSERGNSSAIADELGAGLDTSSADGVRRFCLTCHCSTDGFVWNSDTDTYTAVSATETIAGLRRDGTFLAGQRSIDPSATGNWLRLDDSVPAHMMLAEESCYSCHGGGEDSTPAGADVHNPALGSNSLLLTQALTKPCYACHGAYRSMEDGLGSEIGTASADTFHHVLGNSTHEGDVNQSAGYPSSTSDIYCISCHRGHDTSETTLTTTLRASIDSSAPATTDYSSEAPYGICVSCHSSSLPRDSVAQKSDGTTSTPVVTGGSGTGAFGSSAHNYTVARTLTSKTDFELSCGKCHGGPDAGIMHGSQNANLLATLGGSGSDPLEESMCYRCHSRGNDAPDGVSKPKGGRDWYDAKDMSAAAEATYRAFSLASRHPVAGSLSGSVTCANCHNTHGTSAVRPASDPDNTYVATSYASVFDRTAFCLACHDGTAPSAQTSPSTYVPRTVVITSAKAGSMNKAATLSKGHSSANGSITSGEVVSCDVCHDEHGSTAPKLLGRYDGSTGTNRIGTTTITRNGNDVCYACHTSGTAGTRTTDAAGYPTDGRWPGRAIFTGTFGMHNSSTVRRAGSTAEAGDCKNCHDVHGTSAPYDELVGSAYTPTYFGFCFDCHGPGNAKGFDQKRFYPVSAGGTSTSARAGHATVTNGLRPAGSPMPCYDCHNSHGSGSEYGLEVRSPLSATSSVVVGDAVGEIVMNTSAGVRNFCFTCHTTSDTARGWNGSAMVAISSGAKIEGIDRVSTTARLRLPSTESGHRQSSSANCEGNGCHGASYSAGGNNVHNPRVK